MKVFVSEYVCGGAWNDPEPAPSLEREGRAMLEAIVQDFAQLPECLVMSTLAAVQPPLSISGGKVVRVHSAGEEADVFRQLAAESDACLIIAPELGNVLHGRCEAARRAGARRLLNPDSDMVSLCSDKLRLYEFLVSRGISTIPTVRWSPDTALDVDWSPVVIKPRFGAGSQDIYTYDSVDSARRCGRLGAISSAEYWIAQPLIRGSAVSVGVLCHTDSGSHEILPVAAQHLSEDGHFRYLGGRIPWPGSTRRSDEVVEVVDRVCRILPGLVGYVGFDVTVPSRDSEPPVIVEINPRLTTSYLGYRRLTMENLAVRPLQSPFSSSPIRWLSGAVSFGPDGRYETGQDARCVTPTFSTIKSSVEP